MGDRPLYVAFLWHMHQPYYKDPVTGVYRLPWVRLHGVKDYLDMVKVLEGFPDIRQTVNLVPSLLEQLNDYTENNATDVFLQMTLIDPPDLSERERAFIIENFFLANWDNMIRPFPRYYELLVRRGFTFTKGDISRLCRYFSDADMRDLQVLFNLSWIDPMFRESDPFLRQLAAKERYFTEEDKQLLIEKQRDLLKEIVPTYRRMGATGQVEISASPFYHPILPLLWDTDSARIAMPHVRLPKRRFSYPRDAVKQMEMAFDYFEGLFGYRPSGMWPSEGSVSEDVVRAIGAGGIRWIGTDEEVLAGSLLRPLRSPEGHLLDAPTLYRPHQYGGVSVFFRDHKLSDLIGFVYSRMHPEKAAEDFLGKLLQIRSLLPRDRAYIVPIILDGENAWEYYPRDGHDFLAALYRRLSTDRRFRTVTFSDFLNEHGPGEALPRLHSGSWINGNFGIWIGHEEDNLAWDYLTQTRDDLEEFAKGHPEKDLSAAWSALYAAEGSDWNWWYGDEHVTETQDDFDDLFRGYLIKVYRTMGRDVPQDLYVPILLKDRGVTPAKEIRGFINPRIDGIVSNFYEWEQGALIEFRFAGGSMHRSEGLISRIHYGFNKDNLYLRVDMAQPFLEIQHNTVIQIHILKPALFTIVFDQQEDAPRAPLYEKVLDKWTMVKELKNVAARDIFEVEIPFADIRAKEDEEIDFSLDIIKNGAEGRSPDEGISGIHSVERCPWRGYITVTVPPPHYEKIMWY